MKLKQALLPLAALSLAALLASPLASLAQSTNDAAYSANAVGVIRYTIPAKGVLTCITLPLEPMNATNLTWNWSETTLAQQMDRGSIAYFWTGAEWEPSTKQRSSWSLEKTVVPGQAVFVQGPNTATSNKVISLLGQLPVAPTNYLTLVGGGSLNMSAISTYPVNRQLSESAFSDLPRGSIIYKWAEIDSQWQWVPTTKQRSSWSTDLEFEVGEGAFVELAGDGQILEESCPFNWEK